MCGLRELFGLDLIRYRFDDDFKMIKRKGTIVSFGNASGPVAPVNLFKLVEKNVKLLRPSWV